jgi:hypothetical protein
LLLGALQSGACGKKRVLEILVFESHDLEVIPEARGEGS